MSRKLKCKIISFLAEYRYTHAKMASRKRETYQTEPRTYVLFIFERAINAKIVNKTIND